MAVTCSSSSLRNISLLTGYSFNLKRHSNPLLQPQSQKQERRFEGRALIVTANVQKTLEEEYGSRYERPDRYPRLRRSQAPSHQTGDARSWLEKLATVTSDLVQSDLKDQLFKDNGPVFPEDVVRQQQLLVRQGRLDEVLVIIRAYLATVGASSAATSASGFSPERGVLWGGIDHSEMLEACADAGNVELGFEYASLFPPTIGSYALLASAFALRANPDVAGLAARTAQRRRAPPEPFLSIVCLASALQSGNPQAAMEEFDKMVSEGLVRRGATFEDAKKACLNVF